MWRGFKDYRGFNGSGERGKLTNDDLAVRGGLGDLVDGPHLRVGHPSHNEYHYGWPRLLGCLGLWGTFVHKDKGEVRAFSSEF